MKAPGAGSMKAPRPAKTEDTASDKPAKRVYERTRFPQNNLTVTAAMSGCKIPRRETN